MAKPKRSPPLLNGVDRLRVHLHPERRDLDCVAIVGVHRNEVTVGRGGQAERAVEAATSAQRDAPTEDREEPARRERDRGDAVLDRVGDVEGAVMAERYPRRADDESAGVELLGETGRDHVAREEHRRPARWVEHAQADHRAVVDLVAAGRNRAVQHVRHEQLGEGPEHLQRGHVPGPVDARSGEGLDRDAVAVQHDEATGFGCAAAVVGDRKAAHHHVAVVQHAQRRRQPDAAGARTRERGWHRSGRTRSPGRSAPPA